MAKEPAKDAAREETASEEDRVSFKPTPGLHLTEAGKVALSNWVGRVGNRIVRVYRGAQASQIPEAVQKAMAESNVGIGKVTLEDLGLRPAAGRGAQIINVE